MEKAPQQMPDSNRFHHEFCSFYFNNNLNERCSYFKRFRLSMEKILTSNDFFRVDLRVFRTDVTGAAAVFLPDRVRRAPSEKCRVYTRAYVSVFVFHFVSSKSSVIIVYCNQLIHFPPDAMSIVPHEMSIEMTNEKSIRMLFFRLSILSQHRFSTFILSN